MTTEQKVIKNKVALKEISRKKPNLKNRIAPALEKAKQKKEAHVRY